MSTENNENIILKPIKFALPTFDPPNQERLMEHINLMVILVAS